MQIRDAHLFCENIQTVHHHYVRTILEPEFGTGIMIRPIAMRAQTLGWGMDGPA